MTKQDILDYVKSEHRAGYNLGPHPPGAYKFLCMTPVARYLYREGLLDGSSIIKEGKLVFKDEKQKKYTEAINVWKNEILPVWHSFYRKRRIRNWLIRLSIIALTGYCIHHLILNMHTNRYDLLDYLFYSCVSFGAFVIVVNESLSRIGRYYLG